MANEIFGDSILGGLGVNMGLGSQITQVPQYVLQNALNSQISQALLAQSAAQNQWVAQQAQRFPVMQISVYETKIQSQAKKLVDALPMSIASHVSTCSFFAADKDSSAHFLVRFDNGRSLEFTDIDVFPSDEHIARIALECP